MLSEAKHLVQRNGILRFAQNDEKKLRVAMLLAFGFLSGCSSPAGPCIHYIECPDGDCQQQARELCPHGYKQLGESDVGPDFGDFEKQHFAGADSGVPHMLVTCDP